MGWYATRNLDENDVRKFDTRLYRPPAGYTGEVTEGPWSAEHEMAAFRSVSKALGQ